MREKKEKTEILKADHTTYGGEITRFDFEGHHTLTSMANKIRHAQNFDKQCQKNIEFRNHSRKQEDRETVLKKGTDL